MQKFFTYVAFILSLIFHVQSMAWATGSQTLEGKALTAKFVKHYNALTHEEKLAEANKMLAARPKTDRDYIKYSVGDLTKFKFPELQQSDHSFVFVWDKDEVVVTRVKDTVFKVNGNAIDFAPGKFSDSENHADKIFTNKSVSILDLLIPSAHARRGGVTAFFGAVTLIIGMILAFISLAMITIPLIVGGAIGVVAGGVLALIDNDNDKLVKEKCEQARNQMSDLQSDASASEIFEVKQTIMRAKSDMQANEKCLGDDKQRQEICKQVRLCLDSLDKEIDLYLTAVNRDARDKVKELEKAAPKVNPKKDASKQ